MADIEEIRDRLDLPSLIGQKTQLRRSGNGWMGKCPFHEDKTASLSVSDKLWKCHGGACGLQGDVFTWIEKTEQCDFKAALAIAERLAGVEHSNGSAKRAVVMQPPPASSPASPPLDSSLADKFHADLHGEKLAYLMGTSRGLSGATIDAFNLGWDGNRYTIPIYEGRRLVNIRRRRDDDNRRDKAPKMLNTAGHGSPARLFNGDALLDCDEPIITEGEFDTMVLCQNGWTAMSGTHGADTFLPEWHDRFLHCRVVYVCYDTDLAGRTGAAKAAAVIGEKARIVRLPDPEDGQTKVDVTDFFTRLGKTASDFAELLDQAKAYEAPSPPSEEPPRLLHLAQSAQSDLVGKAVQVRLLVAGKVDAPYIVPRKVKYICYGSEKDRDRCQIGNDSGNWEKTFTDADATFIELCHKRKDQVGNIVKAAAGCPGSCRKIDYQVIEYANVEESLAVPMAERVMPVATSDGNGKITETDESGNEYVARNLYLLNHKASVNAYYQVDGRVYPHPNTQLGTILIAQLEPLQDSIARFELTPEITTMFQVLQLPANTDIVKHVNTLLDDLTNNVTHIYKRDEALLAVLLAYHSVLTFIFEGRPLRRGWVEALLLGDTGLGKTEVVRQIMDFCGLGTLVSGETSTRTGLTYAIEQVNERWFVKWGKYPLNDRRLLAIDELSELSEDDLGKMTQGRNDGVLRVDRAGVGEANCRTRLIWMSNPRNRKGLYDFGHGIEAIKTLFPSPADLRRIDMAVFLAAKDIDLGEINSMHPTPDQQLISGEGLKQSILWAWSRGLNDVSISEETTKAILKEASRLSDLYGGAEDIALVSPADMRVKLARLVVALAALLHSTDDTHQKVMVLPIHVQFIGAFLDSIYSARNCRYDVYARQAVKESALTDDDAAEIARELQAVDATLGGVGPAISRDIVGLYRNNDVLGASDIADQLDLDRRTVTKRLRVLGRHGLIRKTRHGYAKTAKFIEYLMSDDNPDGSREASNVQNH